MQTRLDASTRSPLEATVHRGVRKSSDTESPVTGYQLTTRFAMIYVPASHQPTDAPLTTSLVDPYETVADSCDLIYDRGAEMSPEHAVLTPVAEPPQSAGSYRMHRAEREAK